MLNEDTRYGCCSECGKHRSFAYKVKKRKGELIKVWECLKRKTPTGKKPLAVRKESWKYKRDRADDLWAKLVKVHAGHKCEMAGHEWECNGGLQSHHIVGRSEFTLRWELDNGECLCAKHHINFAEAFPALYHADLERRHPGLLERLSELRLKRKLTGQKTDVDKALETLKGLAEAAA
jgi:hypothetical protein